MRNLPSHWIGRLSMPAALILLLISGSALFYAARMVPGLVRSTRVPPIPTLPAVTSDIDVGSLRDGRGSQRSLAELRGPRGLVLAFWGIECPLAQLYIDKLIAIENEYRPRGVEFALVFPHGPETLDQVYAYAQDHDVPFVVVKDIGQQLADRLGISRVPTVCYLNEHLEVEYQGRIDDQYGVGHRRPEATRADLQQALDERLAGRMVSQVTTPIDGCLLARDRPTTRDPVDFTTVGPILYEHCSGCHRPNGQGPFALTSFDDAVEWSAMIREVVEQRRMPPWHADHRVAEYWNDRSLNGIEIGQILAWVDQGTPRGEPEKQPPPPELPTDRWTLDRVDAVIDCPEEFAIPAEGLVDYKLALAPSDVTDRIFSEDRWLQAGECLPGTPAVVHHIQINLYRPGVSVALEPGGEEDKMVGALGWVPGAPRFSFPPGTGLWIPKGTQLLFEIHYTPNGTATKDRSRVALQFCDAPPEREARMMIPSLYYFRIPPGDPHFRGEGLLTFTQSSRLLALNPHMHWRGKNVFIELIMPDGRRQPVLSVPRYDFGWQTFYWLANPPEVPAGTQLHFVGHWDNSSRNPMNPDPTASVTFGMQTEDEMMSIYSFFDVPRSDQRPSEGLVVIPPADSAGRRYARWIGVALFLLVGAILWRRIRRRRGP